MSFKIQTIYTHHVPSQYGISLAARQVGLIIGLIPNGTPFSLSVKHLYRLPISTPINAWPHKCCRKAYPLPMVHACTLINVQLAHNTFTGGNRYEWSRRQLRTKPKRLQRTLNFPLESINEYKWPVCAPAINCTQFSRRSMSTADYFKDMWNFTNGKPFKA